MFLSLNLLFLLLIERLSLSVARSLAHSLPPALSILLISPSWQFNSEVNRCRHRRKRSGRSAARWNRGIAGNVVRGIGRKTPPKTPARAQQALREGPFGSVPYPATIDSYIFAIGRARNRKRVRKRARKARVKATTSSVSFFFFFPSLFHAWKTCSLCSCTSNAIV